jgi:5-formyltetrahydrofolate cyclo-ligase
MNVQVRKQALRQSIIAAREALGEVERAALSARIAANLLALPSYREAETVLAYLNFGAEFAAEILVQQALHEGKRVLLPKVQGGELAVFQVRDLPHDVQLGRWDIREPIAARCPEIKALHEIDWVLLPGVAFTKNGARLGYGGGFYDKFLARLSHQPSLVAAAFEVQVVEEIPQEATDKSVGFLVTENETVRCLAA